MIDHANKNRKDHIITVEDPIEFVHESKNCLVNHREVGMHTKSFAAALRGALREDPDIILVGEMRDLETIELALDRRQHRPPGLRHAAHAERGQDHRPYHRRVPGRAAEQDSRNGPPKRSRASWRRTFSSASTRKAAGRAGDPGRHHGRRQPRSAKARPHQIPGLIQVGKKFGNQPLDDAIMEHLRRRADLPEEAYDKCHRQEEVQAAAARRRPTS